MTAILVILVLLLALTAWNVFAWPTVGESAEGVMDEAGPAGVSVLIPARDEEHNLPALLESLRAQEGVREILVYDDHSTDGTAAVVDAAAGADPRIRRLAPDPLPPGWSGKTFACDRLATAAAGEWMLFLDADARLSAGAVTLMVKAARAHAVTFLSCWPGLDAICPAEKLFMPMLNFSVFTLFPAPISLSYRFPSLGLAHGACILARRDDYQAVGGHAAVKAELFEDTAIARVWREKGKPGVCLDGQHLVRVRMYDSLDGIRRGFEKIFYPAFRRKANFWVFLTFHAAVFLAPPLLAAGALAAGWLWTPAWVATGLALLMRILQAQRFRYPLWSAFLHPVGEAGLVWVGLGSWHRCRTGLGVRWKGRIYHGRKHE